MALMPRLELIPSPIPFIFPPHSGNHFWSIINCIAFGRIGRDGMERWMLGDGTNSRTHPTEIKMQSNLCITIFGELKDLGIVSIVCECFANYTGLHTHRVGPGFGWHIKCRLRWVSRIYQLCKYVNT